MKKRFAMFLSVCLLLSIAAPGFAAPEAPAATSQTQALIEKIEAADAFTITYAFSLDGVKITDYFKDGRVASDARGGSFPLTIRTLYTGGRGYAFLRGLPLFYLPIDPADAPTTAEITAEMREKTEGRDCTTFPLDRDGTTYTVEAFSDGDDTIGFAFADGLLRLIGFVDGGDRLDRVLVTIDGYRFSAPEIVFFPPLFDLSGLFAR
ncbi:MAG: hypothetical protein IKD72_01020 [Clostridia bacterium]|nr:hypothetical protein [Clostridia bacterium]